MKYPGHPIKAPFGRSAAIDDYQFIADASRTLVIDAFDIDGQFVERLSLAVTTSAQTAKQLVDAQSGSISKHWWWHVVSISAGTIYGLATNTTAVSATNGRALTANDKLGPFPGRGAIIQSVEPPSTGSIGTPTPTNPSLVTATSTTLLAANAARKSFSIQNNGATTLAISLIGAVITGVAPSGTNLVHNLAPGAVLSAVRGDPFFTTSAITGYQASGGTITTVTVTEG